MNSRIENISLLLKLHLKGALNDAQKQELEEWRRLSEANEKLLEDLTGKDLHDALHQLATIDTDAARERLKSRLFTAKKGRIARFRRSWWAAASIILVLAMGTATWVALKRSPELVKTADIQPGRKGAILTLADGTQILLDSLHSGVVANQHGARVLLRDGSLAYDPAGSADGEVVYNTMTIPKGRQFQLVLPDGTKVWLNAASSIRYPTVFTGKERRVEVTGEIYFEVAKNAKMPFRVNISSKAEIEVLGTHFNVNAYENEESINTTLLAGSVRVIREQSGVMLRPGQQAQIARSSSRPGQQAQIASLHGIKVIDHADVDRIMAWKNGLFNFNGASLGDVMRQLERWYEIEVVYEKEIPDITFWGEIPKDISLSGVLAALEKTDVHFRIEGRKVIVMP